MTKAIDIIQDEHRALAAMLQALRTLTKEIEAGHVQPDFDLLGKMLEYVHRLPERVHHPKESDYLFAKLRLRCPDTIPALETLEDDHRQEAARSHVVEIALENYRRVGAAGFAAFRDEANRYIDDEWRHMGLEEREIFPLARRHLTAEDWAAIDAAFLANDNPWQGAAGEYASLFTQIVNTAPPPVGVGGPT